MARGPFGLGLLAARPLRPGTTLCGADDWQDEAEQAAFAVLSPEELAALPPARRAVFLRYAYNVDPVAVCGTFRPEAVRHPSNFIDHSCAPNLGYAGGDRIVALRAIRPGEHLTMDYGTYTFSFDHEFACRCGAIGCRRRVRHDDWRRLVGGRGLDVPAFMQDQARALRAAVRPP